MIVVFTKNLPDRITMLKDANAAKDWANLAQIAHKLKGAGASYGYPKLSENAHIIEKTAQSLAKKKDGSHC